ncbi:MAG TPA: hypothetical protein VGM11_01585 [Acidobacteriaceae bacterium]|jgi:hypothetical protein
MNPELVVSRLYHDVDIIEVAVSVWNGTFGGTVELYVAQDELEEVAEKLRGFPNSPVDQRDVSLGTFDPKLACGGASLRFFCIDRAGHVRLEVKLEGGHPLAKARQRVDLFANIDAASIDSFIPELVSLSRNNRQEAVLRFDGAVMRA